MVVGEYWNNADDQKRRNEMPRTLLKNPYEEAAQLLFGRKGERNISFLAKHADIPKATCCRYREHIETMPLERFAAVCETYRLTDEEIVRVIKKFFRG